MEATMNFLEFNEIEVGEGFIIIHTENRDEKERLEASKTVCVKTAESHRDNAMSRGANAVTLTTREEMQVAHRTPVIRIAI